MSVQVRRNRVIRVVSDWIETQISRIIAEGWGVLGVFSAGRSCWWLAVCLRVGGWVTCWGLVTPGGARSR